MALILMVAFLKRDGTVAWFREVDIRQNRGQLVRSLFILLQDPLWGDVQRLKPAKDIVEVI